MSFISLVLLSRSVKSLFPVGTSVPLLLRHSVPLGLEDIQMIYSRIHSYVACDGTHNLFFFNLNSLLYTLFLVSKKGKSYFMVQNATRHVKSALFTVAGCGLPSCWACFDWDRGVALPHISFSSLRGIHHPVKSRHFYSVVCESAYNTHNSAAHLRPSYQNVRLNKQKSLQLGIPSLPRNTEMFLNKSSNLLTTNVISLLSFVSFSVNIKMIKL